MITEEVKKEKKIILTKPVSLDGNSDAYEAPNLGRRILSLLKDIRPGSDLASFQLSPQFNIPKSQLEGFGEQVYAVREDMLKKCNNGESAVERFIRVVAWSISTVRPLKFGFGPFNPILGETHHVSKGSLNLLIEQVSHHPVVHALHGTDEKENIEIMWCHHVVAKFYGNRVEAQLKGNKQLKLNKHGETYVMNSPKFLVKFLPPMTDWIGNVKIQCQETDLEAELCYYTGSFFGKKEDNSIKGRIFQSSSSKTLHELHGHWTGIVRVKDINTGKESVIFNAKEAFSQLKCPIVRDPQGILDSESAAVWSEVSEAIISKNWENAKEAKKAIEERQRELRRERLSKGQKWLPKHFTVTCNKDGDWDCSPLLDFVPPAPIVVPL